MNHMLHRFSCGTHPWVCLLLAFMWYGALPCSGADPGSHVAAPEDAFKGRTVLITGANRGLGLEFARQFQEAGAIVIGTARHPDEAEELRELGVRIEQLDVTDPGSVAGLAKRIGDVALDILINNAGIFGAAGRLKDVDPEQYGRVFEVNCLGAMRVTQALLPALDRGDGKFIMNISSSAGSIDRNRGGGMYGYRESKAALNMFTRSIAGELKKKGFTCIAMDPGWVRTDMGGANATLSPEESIRGMLTVIENTGIEQTGSFLRYSGAEVPW